LDFDRLLTNLRNSANDFIPRNNLARRICSLAEGFKEDANEMTHSLYHIASKKEVDERNFQQILDLISELEKSIATST
jgi:DNA-binding ferritin-like protein (Dps family)